MELHAVYMSNDGYAPYAGISFTSLFENNKDIEDITIHYLDVGVSKENINKLKSIADKYDRNIIFYKINDEEFCKNLGINVSHSHFIYLDLFLHKILPSNIDKVLKLDSDSIITGSLKDLWNEDIEDYCLAAALEIKLNIDSANHYKKSLGLKETDPYINAGVLLINLKKFREMNFDSQFVKYINDNNPVYCDQDTINVILKDKIKIVDLRYNFFPELPKIGYENVIKWTKNQYYYSKKEYLEALDNISFIHFQFGLAGRPWFKNIDLPFSEEFDKYAKLSPWSYDEVYTDEKAPLKHRLLAFSVYKLPFNLFLSGLSFIRKLKGWE